MQDYLGEIKPTWITEMGITDTGAGGFGGTATDYCDYVLQSFARGRLAGVERFFHFQLDNSNGHGLYQGMLGEPKPVLTAYRDVLAKEFSDAVFVQQLHGSQGVGFLAGNSAYEPKWKAGYNLFEFRSRDGRRRILLAFADTANAVDVKIPATKTKATLIARDNQRREIQARDGQYQIRLPGATNVGGWVWKSPPNVIRPESGKRSNVFFVGEEVTFKLNGSDLDRFEVRDYQGQLVAQGAAQPTIAIPVKAPGWYKLYVYAKSKASPPPTPPGTAAPKEPPPELIWGDVVGGTTFVIFRRDARFPDPSPPGGSTGSYPSMDQIMRGVTGMGPQRHAAHANDPATSIKNLSGDVVLDKQWYVGRDPRRERPLMIAFPNGTKELAGVRQIVEHFRHDVRYYEPRNEPNFGSGATDFVNNELKPFHATIKSIDPQLKVLGPGTVTIGPSRAGLQWIDEFFQAGGAKCIDAFSFHAYNNINGDLWLGRKSLDSLAELLARHGVAEIEKWQTEQGFFACVYGSGSGLPSATTSANRATAFTSAACSPGLTGRSPPFRAPAAPTAK